MNGKNQKKPSEAKRRCQPIDVHIGLRLRSARMAAGMSQTAIGDAVGLTFQQIQKYESGANRISASRMQQFAQALDKSLQWFLIGAPGFEGVPLDQIDPVAQFAATREGLNIVHAFADIPNVEVRRAIADMALSIAASYGKKRVALKVV